VKEVNQHTLKDGLQFSIKVSANTGLYEPMKLYPFLQHIRDDTSTYNKTIKQK
jgi:hypothetical protein